MRSDSSSETPASDGRKSFIATARRAQILQAAVQVLTTKGYAGTSLARIADQAGVAKGVVSYHFDGKDDLLEQVVIDAFTRGAEEMIPHIVAAEDAKGALRAYLQGNIDFLDANRGQIVAVGEVIINLRRPDGGLRFDEAGKLEVVRPLAELLADGQAAGEFTDFDPMAIAYLIRDAIDGVSARLRYDADYDVLGFGAQLINFAERAIHRPSGEESTDSDPTDANGK
ncbi:TetR/AcrR family transcriptional regulator [Microlunatus soli]|uniref:DNA-binding transcriptional regulator, AcrR family n=1 Tax=Microlunatus soli TaxID=630515 RepID=A0A1H1WQT4_9ACTN|nr:TetR/AcrR family transcriptional regulator [Microlunatus soli]SDS98716.1 DNA-binding transcriptional regulator, AcrR family [Microlunatus soli]